MRQPFRLFATLVLTLGTTSTFAADKPIVGLITKTNTNPFFVKMREGFEAKAKELGLTPQAYAGKADGDNDGQVRAIEQLMAAGAKGTEGVPGASGSAGARAPSRSPALRSSRPGRARRRSGIPGARARVSRAA